jgi:hypothetical protein
MDWQELTTREWAAVVWTVMLVVASVATPFVRRAFAPVLRMLMGFWQLQLALVASLGWAVVVCYFGGLVGAWSTALLKDTVAWIVVYGFASVFSAHRAAKEEHFFRRAALAALSVSALMQFVLNLHTFDLVVELVLLPVVTFLLLLEAVAGMDSKTRPAQNLVNGLLVIVGLWVVIATARGLVDSWRGIDPEETGLAFAFSIWFPLAMLPFVYTLSLVMAYEIVLGLSSFRNDGNPPPISVKAAMALGPRGNLRAVNDLPQHHVHYRAISSSRGFREALGHVREYERARQDLQRETAEKAARLVEYAGVKGLDDDGKVLDQREINETREALRWIETCHLGHHNNNNRGKYRKDLMSGVLLEDFTRHGLPDDHGITMRVRKDGQAWYAWRRTPSGQVLGIGMNEGRDNEWLFDGEEPPTGFPGSDPTWGDRPYETPPNWR